MRDEKEERKKQAHVQHVYTLTALGVVLLCFVVCMTLLASFFLPSASLINMYMCCFALFVCLTLLASFFLPSHLSFKNMYIYYSIINMTVHYYCGGIISVSRTHP